MLISPCGGCDPHLTAAVVCYLSFFLSGCSFFLYWYWLANYRDEQNPFRYPDGDNSDCETLEPEPLDETSSNVQQPLEEGSRSPRSLLYHRDHGGDQDPSTSRASATADLYSFNFDENFDNYTYEEREALRRPSSPGTHSLSSSSCSSSDSSIDGQRHCDNPCPDSINSIGDEEVITGTTIDANNHNHNHQDIHGEEEEQEEEEGSSRGKYAISDNPYLNGDTYTQNVLWAVHGILTNLVETILAGVFYSGLFENNLTTTLVWVIGFSLNFLFGNLLYVLLLIYCTNRKKLRELGIRWALESGFNISKDLYYIWVGVAFLDNLVEKKEKESSSLDK